MKFIHTSDWHLGRTLHGADMVPAQRLFIDSLVDLAKEHRVDAVLISGDVYDRALPSAGAVELLEDALHRLTKFTRVIYCPGNHDSAKRLGFGAEFFRDELVVVSRLSQVGKAVPVADGVVYPLPYLEPIAASHFFGTATTHQDVMSAAMQLVSQDLQQRRQKDPSLPAVVMAHAFVLGGISSDSERDISIGGVEAVSADLFEKMSYVALGHLHRYQHLQGPVPIYYSGSPVPYSFSEAGTAKCALLVACQDGNTTVTRLPIPQVRPIATITGTLEELLSPAFASYQDAWVAAQVTDVSRPPNLHRQLLERFPHLLTVQFVGAQRRPSLPTTTVVQQDPVQVTIDFAQQVGRKELTQKGKQIVEQIWHQVRKGDEHAAS